MNARTKITLLVCLAILCVAPFFLSPYHTTLLLPAIAYSIILLGFNLLFGYTGLLSFGHALFVAVGAYTVAILTSRLGIKNMELIFLCAISASVVIAVPVGLICVRYVRIFFGMLTLAFGMLFHSILFKLTYQAVILGYKLLDRFYLVKISAGWIRQAFWLDLFFITPSSF